MEMTGCAKGLRDSLSPFARILGTQVGMCLDVRRPCEARNNPAGLHVGWLPGGDGAMSPLPVGRYSCTVAAYKLGGWAFRSSAPLREYIVDTVSTLAEDHLTWFKSQHRGKHAAGGECPKAASLEVKTQKMRRLRVMSFRFPRPGLSTYHVCCSSLGL